MAANGPGLDIGARTGAGQEFRHARRPALAPGSTESAGMRRLLCCLVLLVPPLLSHGVERTLPADFARLVFDEVNLQRERQGLPLLALASELESIALEQSRVMAALGRLDHAGFNRRFAQVPASRICVENLAAGFRRADALVAGWAASPRHRGNLFEPRVRRVGVASVGGFVSLFACD